MSTIPNTIILGAIGCSTLLFGQGPIDFQGKWTGKCQLGSRPKYDSSVEVSLQGAPQLKIEEDRYEINSLGHLANSVNQSHTTYSFSEDRSATWNKTDNVLKTLRSYTLLSIYPTGESRAFWSVKENTLSLKGDVLTNEIKNTTPFQTTKTHCDYRRVP